MTLFDLFLIAVSLSMDAFAVSICKGLSVRKVSLQHAMICGVWFGGFQFLMPALGYFLGDRFAALLTKFGPWIAFVLLALIGANMIKESFGGDEQLDDDYSAKAMLPLAIATSIDAFAVGVSFAAMQVDILPAAGLIGVITCLLSAIGVKVGAMFGDKYRAPAERIGGIVHTNKNAPGCVEKLHTIRCVFCRGEHCSPVAVYGSYTVNGLQGKVGGRKMFAPTVSA